MSQTAAFDQAVERDYNPRLGTPDFQSYFDREAALSEATRKKLPHRRDVSYGSSPLQALDVFGAGPPGGAKGKPIAIFIHGGYWRALDKASYSFFAEPVVAAGGIAVTVNYDLCPKVTIDDIVAQVRASIAWVAREAAGLGGDAGRIVICGHSAGGHLAAMACLHDWTKESLPADLIKGACLVSGVYDIAPVMRTSIQEQVRMTPDIARRNSPLLMPPPRPGIKLMVSYGGKETRGFIDQSRRYAAYLRANLPVVLELPDDNHFSICDRLADPKDPQVRFILDLFG
ncbi:MAG: alpha/beta hydrolase [Alphaproteobacteria bacterium]|nr:alpha/beta hydrolase [Alphaproteobacteria bacterium]